MEKNLPRVSVVIPAFNEEKYIGLCLESVKSLNYPADLLEIIVVDNGSTDRTVEIASAFGVQVYVWPQVRVGAVRNYGVSKSTGDVIAFLDGDCLAPENWLITALDFMTKNLVKVVGGSCLLRSDPSWVESAWVIQLPSRDKLSRILAGGSIIIERDTFLAVGGFNEALNAGEDSALGEALSEAGHKIFILKDCAVVHLGYPRTLKEFTLRQYWHSSSYFKSKKSYRIDIGFLMVLTFLACLVITPFLFYFIPFLGFFSSAIFFLMPAALSVKRIFLSHYRSNKLDSYLKIYVLDFFYLVGRAAGLVKSAFTEIRFISDKKTHY